MTDVLAIAVEGVWALHVEGALERHDDTEFDVDVDWSTSQFDAGIYLIATITRWTSSLIRQAVRV